ncbi:MAG: enoyl-CoA hydratase/isomerase family protein [Sulfurifustaceae bacterium]
MTFQTLEIDIRDRIATVWMNRPDVHNAFDETLIRELTEAFAQLGRDPNARVIVLAGRGKSFSAGADLNWMKRAASYSVEESLRDARGLAAMLDALHRLPKPTVARVHGAALGGGVGLVAACDIAIASTDASFGMTEVKLGLIPSVISPYVIAAIGRRAAHRYFLTAERFGAAEAHRLGLAHAVCAPDALDADVAQIVAALLGGGPGAQATSKDLIAAVVGKPIDAAIMEETAKRIAAARATVEAKEGIAAFLEKRKPRW